MSKHWRKTAPWYAKIRYSKGFVMKEHLAPS